MRCACEICRGRSQRPECDLYGKQKPKLLFWAVGLNFDYDILAFEVIGDDDEQDQPRSKDWGSIEGPFNSVHRAKAQVRKWIKSDRVHLANELATINAWTIKK